MLIKLAAYTNKITHIDTKKGEETGRKSNNSMCSAGASADTTSNKSTVCVHSGLKYDNLNGRCVDIIYYITLGPKSTAILT